MALHQPLLGLVHEWKLTDNESNHLIFLKASLEHHMSVMLMSWVGVEKSRLFSDMASQMEWRAFWMSGCWKHFSTEAGAFQHFPTTTGCLQLTSAGLSSSTALLHMHVQTSSATLLHRTHPECSVGEPRWLIFCGSLGGDGLVHAHWVWTFPVGKVHVDGLLSGAWIPCNRFQIGLGKLNLTQYH